MEKKTTHEYQPIYSGITLRITLLERSLYVERGHRAVQSYPIAIGKPSTPTPTGIYKITEKIVNPGGILGTRWLGLSIPDGPYGIHGTWSPSSIGKAVSNGCIRMHNKDVEELFRLARIGTTVMITSNK